MKGTPSGTERRIGRIIRGSRLDHGWTLCELGKRARTDFSQLSKIERGISGTDIATYQRLARALGIELSQLFDTRSAA